MYSGNIIAGVLFVLIGIFLASNGATVIAGYVVILIGVLMLTYVVLKVLYIPKVFYSGYSKLGKPIVTIPGTSIYGLPQGETKCVMCVYVDCIAYVSGKQVSKVKIEKVSSAYLKTRSELKSAKVGTVVAGAMFFGTIGAIIGSRPRTDEEYVLILNYLTDGEAKAIAIATDKNNKINCSRTEKIINRLVNKKQKSREIEL